MSIIVAVGAAFLSGNSLAPLTDVVVGVVTWAQLPAREQRAWRTIQYWRSQAELEADTYVTYRTRGRKALGSSPRDVFEATRYETHDAMLDAYASRANAWLKEAEAKHPSLREAQQSTAAGLAAVLRTGRERATQASEPDDWSPYLDAEDVIQGLGVLIGNDEPGDFRTSFTIIQHLLEKTKGPHDRDDCPCVHPHGEQGPCAGCNCADEVEDVEIMGRCATCHHLWGSHTDDAGCTAIINIGQHCDCPGHTPQRQEAPNARRSVGAIAGDAARCIRRMATDFAADFPCSLLDELDALSIHPDASRTA